MHLDSCLDTVADGMLTPGAGKASDTYMVEVSFINTFADQACRQLDCDVFGT